MASGLTFKSLNHFEFISVHVVRQWANIILRVAVLKLHLLKTIFSPLCVLASFVVN